MNNSKSKGLIIDFVILTIICIFLIVGLYTTYEIFPKLPRLVAVLVIISMTPVFWGTIILSVMGRKTIGNRIASKKNNK